MSVDQCSVHRKLRCEMDEETQPEAVLKPIKMEFIKKKYSEKDEKNKQIFNLQEFSQLGD